MLYIKNTQKVFTDLFSTLQYVSLRFGLANAINNYLRLEIHVICVGIF
jgi:hypothetical protein